jgi:hypothetical protein
LSNNLPPIRSLYGLINEERFADVCDFGDGALEVESLGEYDLEDLRYMLELIHDKDKQNPMTDLLHVDAVARAAEDQRGAHGLCETAGLG